jgi:hypothetical protein
MQCAQKTHTTAETHTASTLTHGCVVWQGCSKEYRLTPHTAYYNTPCVGVEGQWEMEAEWALQSCASLVQLLGLVDPLTVHVNRLS